MAEMIEKSRSGEENVRVARYLLALSKISYIREKVL